MEGAVFSLVNYRFTKVSIDFSLKSDNKNWKVRLTPHGVYREKTGVFELSFTFDGVLQNVKSPVINVRCDAVFKFNNALSRYEIPDYFYRNCIAILFPYVRAFVSTLTLQANIPPVILPTYNLSSLGDSLLNNTVFK